MNNIDKSVGDLLTTSTTLSGAPVLMGNIESLIRSLLTKTTLPANAAGFLHNDGTGILAWQAGGGGSQNLQQVLGVAPAGDANGLPITNVLSLTVNSISGYDAGGAPLVINDSGNSGGGINIIPAGDLTLGLGTGEIYLNAGGVIHFQNIGTDIAQINNSGLLVDTITQLTTGIDMNGDSININVNTTVFIGLGNGNREVGLFIDVTAGAGSGNFFLGDANGHAGFLADDIKNITSMGDVQGNNNNTQLIVDDTAKIINLQVNKASGGALKYDGLTLYNGTITTATLVGKTITVKDGLIYTFI